MFLVELVMGLLGDSTGLIADGLDMLADASVYAIALFAVGRAGNLQANAAMLSGVLQIILGLTVVLEVGQRYMSGSEPVSAIMMVVGALALAANAASLRLISGHREGGVHMRASWIFSVNDVLANIGVIISGLLVLAFRNRIPDLVIGALISAMVIRGGVQILREAREARLENELRP